ncbi:hypothetical protein AQUCO_01400944v1 [Aquilegia coerulea]|uniref:NAC domain-containing protein n=1 Tax=Aquilegia coerulea TaxID=218851 RepID=A0A2G5DZ18_AQUCA|nr:hypothetical protein AQUCO_01400944v1 [Aquilegia coerulea]
MVDVSSSSADEAIELPPGFRFHPTDEEIITNYLSEKILDTNFTARAIGEVDLNKCEPWDLPKRARMGEKEWYFFCQRDRKYPTGMRTNRATEAGYWKATGKDKEIYNKGSGGRNNNCLQLIGMKKTLVFYRGRAPKGEKTNWVMHEYRLEGKQLSSYHNHSNKTTVAKDEWVVCRVFHKTTGVKKSPLISDHHLLRMNSFGEDYFFDSPSVLPPLLDHPPPYFVNTNSRPPATSTSIDNNNNNNNHLYDLDQFHDRMATQTSSSMSMTTTDDGNHFYSRNMYDENINHHHHHQHDNKNLISSNNNYTMITNINTPSKTNNYYPQIPFPNPLFSFQGSVVHSGYLQHQEKNNNSVGPHDQAILRPLTANNDSQLLRQYCKVEQYSSNQSILSMSQDTGLSTDVNTEISSSVASKHDMGGNRSYEDFEGPSSSEGPVVDLECLWNY